MKPPTRIEQVINALLWLSCVPVWVAAFWVAWPR